MKRAPLLLTIFVAGLFAAALAQVPPGTRMRHASMPSYRHTAAGNKLDFVIAGSSVSNIAAQTLMVDDFVLTSFKNGDQKQTNVIAEAPHCRVDVANNVASSAGPVRIFTATTNLYVEGVGFVFTQSNHFLIISNEVKTRVVKSLLKSSMLSGGRSNAPATNAGVIYISADRGVFNMDSNVVDYAGGVHMIDPQLDLKSEYLTIRFATNGTVQSVLAQQNVILTTTNNGVATGEWGLYWVTNGNEMMRLTNNAAWQNGDQTAKAEEFDYDSTRHFLTARGKVKVRWPNQALTPAERANRYSVKTTVGTNGFRELIADYAELQFPPTNGPVQSMHAQGNVIIINDEDQSKAMAERADYQRAADRVDLTGSPVWWTTNIEVKADVLTAKLGDKVYYAERNARFKTRTGGGASKRPGRAARPDNDQWLHIASDNIEYRTNLAIFTASVHAQLTVSNAVRDTLDCDLLTMDLTSNQVSAAYAVGHVYGETAPNKEGVVKSISCQKMVAYRSVATGLLKKVDAYTNVVLVQKGTGSNAPCNTLKADFVTAKFSATTNQIERADADSNVVFDQQKGPQTTHATAEHGIYTTVGTNDQVKLTGEPLANNGSYLITGSDYMLWNPKSNLIRAFGRYTIVPMKKEASPKSL
jgi:lipopolysaccharide export system protein LptA